MRPEIRVRNVEEIVGHIPQETVQNYSLERIVEALVPQNRTKVGQVTRFNPRERISDCVVEQNMFMNGRWVTVTGGDTEFFKKLTATDMLDSPEASTREDVTWARVFRARGVVDVCQAAGEYDDMPGGMSGGGPDASDRVDRNPLAGFVDEAAQQTASTQKPHRSQQDQAQKEEEKGRKGERGSQQDQGEKEEQERENEESEEETKKEKEREEKKEKGKGERKKEREREGEMSWKGESKVDEERVQKVEKDGMVDKVEKVKIVEKVE